MAPRKKTDPSRKTDPSGDDGLVDAVVEAALADIPFDGWSDPVLARACDTAGLSPAERERLFGGGVRDLVAGFASWADRRMLARLAAHDLAAERVRDRIRLAVEARLMLLTPYRESVRSKLAWLARPGRTGLAGRLVWQTADTIWRAAGDRATDLNHYTKRGLLSGVLASTTLCWLGDETEDLAPTRAFLDRRISEVLQVGGRIGRLRGRLDGLEAAWRRLGALRYRSNRS